jgi:hypothetical protein
MSRECLQNPGRFKDLIATPKRSAPKRGPASKLQQQLERISALPKAQQRFVMQMLDTVLQQQGE